MMERSDSTDIQFSVFNFQYHRFLPDQTGSSWAGGGALWEIQEICHGRRYPLWQVRGETFEKQPIKKMEL